MRDVILDGSKWQRPDDFYDSFFQAVGAPKWHGRNFDALRDSISTGEINQIEVPYRIVILDFDRVGPNARQIVVDFVSLIKELSSEGCPVEIEAVGHGLTS